MQSYASVALVDRRGWVLLQERDEHPVIDPEKWGFPGGGVEDGETYEVAFLGFLPGFAYLTGIDPALALPRRATPRPRVPAGALAIAAGYAGIYPIASPGGWHLLGTALVPVWDDEGPRFAPSDRVRFVEAP